MIDGQKINHYIEANKKKKPDFIVVSDEQWAEALDGCYETYSNGFEDKTTTEEAWHIIYFTAISFCKGMEYAEVKAGIRKESFYPRY